MGVEDHAGLSDPHLWVQTWFVRLDVWVEVKVGVVLLVEMVLISGWYKLVPVVILVVVVNCELQRPSSD